MYMSQNYIIFGHTSTHVQVKISNVYFTNNTLILVLLGQLGYGPNSPGDDKQFHGYNSCTGPI